MVYHLAMLKFSVAKVRWSMMNVAKLREEKHLTQKALADLTGVTQGFIWQIENGISNPSVDTLKKLAAALGCTIDELVKSDT